jgi:DNA-binding transcriptional regulator PaaX
MGEKRSATVAKGVTKAVLGMLAGGGVIGIAMAFPAAGAIHKEFKKQQWEEARQRGILGSTIKRLEKQDLVSWKDVNGQTQLTLTENGKRKTLQFAIDNLKINKPKQWDGLWRIIIFDIPENKRAARDILRKNLKDLECQQLQKSVFVTRYDCKDEIDFLRHSLEIAPNVNFIVAKEISGIEKS